MLILPIKNKINKNSITKHNGNNKFLINEKDKSLQEVNIYVMVEKILHEVECCLICGIYA